MQIALEDLEYQRRAIATLVGVLAGQVKNSFDNSNLFGIQANVTDLMPSQIEENKHRLIAENGISEADAKLDPSPDICIEMETGTGKTLVYLRTAYELYREYRLTKFIILVPSVAIKEGVLQAFEEFKKPLADRYGFTPAYFEYDSGKLSRLRHFIEDTQPQIMVMTVQSMTSDDRIINQAGRDDSFGGLTFLQSLGQCRPVIIMDEPQEGMDTDNAVTRRATLDPLLVLRYSATHKVVKNLLFRLTPFDAYREGMVKKIEVLNVAEKNDEAMLKIEFSAVQTGPAGPKAKLTVWRQSGEGFKWKETNWLKVKDDLAEKSGNVSYRDYTIERIWKDLRDGQYHLKFYNNVELILHERKGDVSGLFREQLHWLIRRHFEKKTILAPRGIKCLSLVFIDKVDNYVRDDGKIRLLFQQEYAAVYKQTYGSEPAPAQIVDCQGYYFAKAGGGEYTDSENAMLKNKKIFNEILRDKRALLDLANPREFIFTHSALGVGWDNPNIFNIATLNESYSDIKKRQELGRGLRICRNQAGQRVYDPADVTEGEETNLLTVVPNETYETFAAEYQEQLKDATGKATPGSPLRRRDKDQKRTNRATRTALFESDEFRRFWEKLARKTDYTVAFHEEDIIDRAVAALDAIKTDAYQSSVESRRITELNADGFTSAYVGSAEGPALRAHFSPTDLIEEISENTSLSYPTTAQIVARLTNLAAVVRNPPVFVAEAVARIQGIELEEMLRTLSYHPTGESLSLTEFKEFIDTDKECVDTPVRGIYDKVAFDSQPERAFALSAEHVDQVVCFLKLPKFYRIFTPIGRDNSGFYEPDFGLIVKRRNLRSGDVREYYFVVETKSTNNIDDCKALTDTERWKIRCALKHFEAIGIEAQLDYLPYVAPVKDYRADFREKLPTP